MKSLKFKFAIRSLWKHKSFSLISLAGLATALAAFVIISTYYLNELSFDKHIPDSERTYRIITRLEEGNFWARTFACYTDALVDFPEVESLTSFIYAANAHVNIDQNEFTVSESVIADTSFIDFFGLELVAGRKQDIGEPNTLFITPDLAEVFFPGEDPLGKEVFVKQFEGSREDSIGHFTVAGIVKPLPENTHFAYQMIFSQKGHFTSRMNHLKTGILHSANVYVRLHQGVPVSDLEPRLTDALLPFLKGKHGPPIEAFNSSLQAVREIHFTRDIHREIKAVTSKSSIYLLLSVGLLILMLMTLNFISAVIVQSHQQKASTGIMRILGASKQELFRLSLLKIVMLVGMGLLISWAIVALSEPFLQSVFGADWSLRSYYPHMLLVGMGTGIPIVILAALGMHLPLKKSSHVFGVLTIVQFAIVVFLLGFSMMIERQLSYMDHKDLGFTDENIFVVRIPGSNPRGSFLVEEMEQQAGVLSASTMIYHPGDIFQSMEFSVGEKSFPFAFRMVDSKSLETLQIGLIERFCSPDGPLTGWIINETFYKHLLQDFSAEDIATSNFNEEDVEPDRTNSGVPFVIGGVMEDFHYSSLHNSIGNFAFALFNPETSYMRWLTVRFVEGQAEGVQKAFEQMMDTHFHGRSYDFFLLEDNLNEKYAASGILSKVIRRFTVLAILIAISGLYGLTLFITKRRSKEIGIRKVYGAGSRQILLMLNLGFLKWVGLAFIIACPLTLLALQKWLVNFAYKTTLSWWIFVLPGLIVACIAMLAVSWQTSAAARSNPVDTLSSNQ
jgi:putative ABC transport system permease protein